MKKLRLHLHAEGDTCDVCQSDARRDGEIKGLLRAARKAAYWSFHDAGAIATRDWCRSEAARLRKGR